MPDPIPNPIPTPNSLNTLLQKTGTISPDAFSISSEGGKAEATYLIGSEFLDQYLKDILGYTLNYKDKFPLSSETGLARDLPLANGQRPFLFADAVSKVEGYQYLNAQDWEYNVLGDDKKMDAPPFFTYPQYREYSATVSFSPRPYQVLSDTYIQYEAQAVKQPYDTLTSFTQYTPLNTAIIWSNIMPEWLRYTVKRITPRTEFLTANQGCGTLWVPGGFLNGQGAGESQIKTLYASTDVTFKLYQIPYSWITGNAATEFKTVFDYAAGCVNSHYFEGYEAGTLLYTGVNVDSVYSQAFPSPSFLYTNTGIDYFYYANNLLCDITITFFSRNPPPGADYKTGGSYADPTDRNRIYNGHNLVPRSQDGKYYMLIYNSMWDTAAGVPKAGDDPAVLFRSFPFQLLFTNPEVTVPILIANP